MVGPDFARMMARYNSWQNASLYGAADGLSDEARRQDRGAFFSSIHGTLSHLLWGDTMWMSRLAGGPRPTGTIAQSPDYEPDWDDLVKARHAMDRLILGWADTVPADALAGDLTWYSGALGREVSRPMGVIVAHVFNHQTHHRGQVHAMLTAAGARPHDTDLFAMPGLA